ncbi:juvenile hormone esterase-like [Sabethes cyaneus]|uniref:juvenile hormone esterase-like n=1 Tax=Sabethes cyaneus TaxID=53552 RepID=UPI00237ECCED|nr:juvenile hormone esterase-like [Sabethes cyaneus]
MSVIVSIVVWSTILSLTTAGVGQQPEENPCRVEFDDGSAGVGVLNRTFNGLAYCEYLGIRYAEPPVGSLRFQAPVIRAPNSTEQYGKVGNICAQLDTLVAALYVHGDEDCLFLNVYSPLIPSRNETMKKFPVMVYIHGGSYAIWSPQTDMFGVDLLIENEILVVSFNYRLFVLGFLHYPEYNISGNFGLKDQLVALQWVQQYIEPFGGDPNNVTVLGQSVGAHSVTYYLYLEQFSGLFHRAIAMSGSLLAPSAMIYRPDDFTPKYLKAVNISSKEQLMSVPFADLFLFHPKARRFVFATIGLPIFLPTVEQEDSEDALVTKPVHELILGEPVNQVPLMIGMTACEFTPYFSSAFYFEADENFPNHDGEGHESLRLVLELVRKAAKLAQKLDPNGVGWHFYGKLSDLVNMYYPVKKLLWTLRGSDSYQDPIYYYRFEFDGKFGKYKNRFYKGSLDVSYHGATHGDDLGYLFSPYNLKEALINRSDFMVEWEVSERNVERISNFIKYGTPTKVSQSSSDKSPWESFNGNNSEAQYLNIDKQVEMRADDDSSNYIFQVWDRAYNCLFYSNCTPTRKLLDRINRQLNSNTSETNLMSIFNDENVV